MNKYTRMIFLMIFSILTPYPQTELNSKSLKKQLLEKIPMFYFLPYVYLKRLCSVGFSLTGQYRKCLQYDFKFTSEWCDQVTGLGLTFHCIF